MFKQKITFQNFPATPALRSYVAKSSQSLKRRLEIRGGRGLAELHVVLRLDAKAPLGDVKSNSATVHVKVPGQRKLFIAAHKDRDLRKAIDQAVHAIEKQIRRATEKSESKRKQLKKIQFIDL